MESLRESDADQLVEITGEGAPARVLVVTKTEQVDIPRHYSQYSQSCNTSFANVMFLLFARYFSDKHFRVI